MTTQATPGPWHFRDIRPYSDARPLEIYGGHVLIAEVGLAGKRGQTRANAALIAAAPDLLTVANGALGYLQALPEAYRPDEAWLAPLRAAIAKASSIAQGE